MIDPATDPVTLAGLEIVDPRGERIGRVRQVYPDGDGIAWAGVRGNLFGTEEVLVPLAGALVAEDTIEVPVTRRRFITAPRRRSDATLGDAERDELVAYWSAPVPASAVESVEPAPPVAAPDDSMTRSEERLHVETERVPRTRVRLRKVVVTEQQTVTVPVRREEVRLVREPIEGAEPVAGGMIGPVEQELVLYEERVVVTREVVPVERVRLVKEDVTEQREVVGAVRKERIEFDEDLGPSAAPSASPAPSAGQLRLPLPAAGPSHAD